MSFFIVVAGAADSSATATYGARTVYNNEYHAGCGLPFSIEEECVEEIRVSEGSASCGCPDEHSL